MFEQIFKNIDDLLYKDAGADSELDYIGQTSWVLFLRYLHDLEAKLADTAELEGREHSYILNEEFRWNSWAMPQRADGSYDKNEALAGNSEFFTRQSEQVLLDPGNSYEKGGYHDSGVKQKHFEGKTPEEYVLQAGDLLVAMSEQGAGLLGSSLLVPENDTYLDTQRLGFVQAICVAMFNECLFHILTRVRCGKRLLLRLLGKGAPYESDKDWRSGSASFT